MPLPTLACTIDSTGIHAPTFDEILQSLIESFQAIYGSDVYLGADSQDGEWLAILARAFDDHNQADIAVWNATRPSFAVGAGLSSLVAINGIVRQVPSNSVADGSVIGVAGTTITNGVVIDLNGNKWDLPETVVIPEAGTITVSVVAQDAGAIVAPAGTINVIGTPVSGWQFFQSTTDALSGTAVETDAALRRRQTTSAALTGLSNLDGLLASLEAIDTVTRTKVYENNTGGVDANGLVAHSIAVVIEGGNVLDIATTIGQKKAPGCDLNGDVVQSYTDPLTGISYDGAPGNPPAIKFYRLTETPIMVTINLDALDGWNDDVEAEIQQAVADYINGLAIGQKVAYSRVYVPAQLFGTGNASAFQVTNLLVNGSNADIVVPFKNVAAMEVTDVSIVVNP